MFRKKAFWIGLVIALAVAAGGGYAYYNYVYLPEQEPSEPTIATAEVRRGDLVISVSGSGTLVPASEMDLGFETGGYLAELLVEVGDHVQAGDVLARLETDQLEQAVAQADVNVRLAQFELADAREGPTDAELAAAAATVRDTQVELDLAQGAYDAQDYSDLDAQAVTRQYEYEWFRNRYWAVKTDFDSGRASQWDLDNAYNDMLAAEGRLNETLEKARAEQIEAQNRVDKAVSSLYQAREKLELLQSEPLTQTLMQAELKVDQALLALEDARADLEAAVLRAPFDGTVMVIQAQVGESVGSGAFITLADLEKPLLCFWVEESDMSGVAVGNRVEIIFEALLDDTFTGEVIRVDPALVTVDGMLAVQAWASIDLSSRQTALLSGMNADVEIISAEARDAVLVPIQALRELSQGQYAVFAVQSDGELVLRPVEVGLKDLVNAEILSGLEVGEVVSTGEQESTQATTTTVVPEQMPGGGPMMIGPP